MHVYVCKSICFKKLTAMMEQGRDFRESNKKYKETTKTYGTPPLAYVRCVRNFAAGRFRMHFVRTTGVSQSVLGNDEDDK